MSKIIIPKGVVDYLTGYMKEHPSDKIRPEELINQSKDKIQYLINQLNINDYAIFATSDEQILYVLKVKEDITLEVTTPLMKNSEGEFYAVSYNGECYHTGAATISDIADEIKRLIEWIKKK